MKNLKTPARLPRKAPSNQTGGTAWGKKLAAEFSRMAQAADMKKLILLNFPYIIAFYMVEKAAWLYRHCNGDSVVERLMVLFMNFGLAYKNALPSFHPFDLLVGLVGAVVLKAVIYFKGKNAKKYRQGEEYGSARWGNQKDIEPFIDPVFENNVILTQTERLMMSGRPKHPKYARNKNVIVIGGSGSGKTRFYVKPNLMQMPQKVSYVVTDPKGTIIIECGKMLSDAGYKIKVLNTINFKKSMRYNPFHYIRSEKDILKLLSGMVESNLSTMFTAVNQQTSEIATQVGQTPQGWNSSIFSMIRNISDSVVIPIAGIIITLILCYELISMLTERNNLHDVDTWMFFKYFVKMWIAVYLVSHTFDIAMAVFDIGQSVVNSSSGIIRGNTAIDISSLSMQMQAAMATMAIGELVTLALETLVVSWCLKILSVVITVIMYGRMIEIYLYTSLAPIPFATMSNREWGHVGTNYFRGLFALAFQAFLMMVCVAIYAALIGSIRVSSDIHSALFGTMAYTVILCFSLLKTGSLSKQIFGSH